ncbi:chemotaxis protein CheA [Methylobacter tundripaludum]|uniref:Chemotaxis protein CheA n=1 Tax=Methylobacter tundripaludum (strain ATCC BAA-1195 / DSM 17260 / SV96) TaxID=697282 RepID=G3IWW3_METTV|nr:chemotaxis protein CheA [Methylobacter tundripaludum]EGW23318.1 CheA signal transduction histidine kinase [Methylobacter tundripaludum SV96]
MNPLLEQFLSEARDFLHGIAEKLMQLENDPGSTPVMNELFRLVHTLKGNSGLFEFPEMTRVLHAGEDLLDAVRDGRVGYSQELTDRLLDAMDFVNLLVDEIESNDGAIGSDHAQNALRLAESLRQLIGVTAVEVKAPVAEASQASSVHNMPELPRLAELPEQQRMALYREALAGDTLLFVEYTPEQECFFKGEDPFHQARQIPDVVWQSVLPREPWSAPAELDAYHCNLVFNALTTAAPEELYELFRYTPEQLRIVPLPPIVLALPHGDPNGGPVYGDFVTDALGRLDTGDMAGLESVARTMLELSSPSLWLSSGLRWLLLVLELEPGNRYAQRTLIESLGSLTLPVWTTPETAVEADSELVGERFSEADARAFADILQAQREILGLPDSDAWLPGRLNAAATALAACQRSAGRIEALPTLEAALAEALDSVEAAPLLAWLDAHAPLDRSATAESEAEAAPMQVRNALIDVESDNKFGRRVEDSYVGPKTLKVDQDKIDNLMGLIGEMVVAKNSLPYLASRAETQYGVRELGREIKTQYAVINRIAEEMQDAIMQVRMMPVSFVFQRFPRLVRDTSRKLAKEVNLILEGENTEADKNIVEALADPLIHIVRNSLDHGIETPEVRRAAGKPPAGRLTIRATQEADRVYIEISDDGKGIDPTIIKRKAYEKGIIDESTMERLSDQEAVNLVFAAGFSTAEVISDLSGRGVGMDVVRSAVEKVNGTVSLESELGKGTLIRLSLPLSMAVTNVMIVESDKQIFGVPMDMVVETVRVSRSAIRTIKKRQTTVLRGRIVPLLALNELLAIDAEPYANEDDELATLVVRVHEEHVGIVVDDFRETVDIILKPMAGIIGGLGGYSGSALLGDGSVLMVLNPRELV